MKKILIPMLFISTFVFSNLSQAALAGSLTLNKDYTVFGDTGKSKSKWEVEDSNSLYVKSDKKKESFTYLTFDTNALSNVFNGNEKLTSATLNLYTYSTSNLNSLPNLYYYSNDAIKVGKKYKLKEIDYIKNGSLIDADATVQGKSNLKKISYDLTQFFLNVPTKELTDKYISFVLEAPTDKYSLGFYSSEHNCAIKYNYTPELTFASAPNAPVPEPSTVILGLMGLAGALGIRRKNK